MGDQPVGVLEEGLHWLGSLLFFRPVRPGTAARFNSFAVCVLSLLPSIFMDFDYGHRVAIPVLADDENRHESCRRE